MRNSFTDDAYRERRCYSGHDHRGSNSTITSLAHSENENNNTEGYFLDQHYNNILFMRLNNNTDRSSVCSELVLFGHDESDLVKFQTMDRLIGMVMDYISRLIMICQIYLTKFSSKRTSYTTMFILTILVMAVGPTTASNLQLYQCPNGFLQYSTSIAYANSIISTCQICDGSFTCSDNTDWNGGAISFSNPLLSTDKLVAISGNLLFQYDTCDTNTLLMNQSNILTISFNNQPFVSSTLVSGGCSCFGCSQFAFSYTNYDILKNVIQSPTTQFRIDRTYDTNICVNRIDLTYCYVHEGNITSYAVTSSNGNNLDVDISNITSPLSQDLIFNVSNSGPDASRSLDITFQFSSLATLSVNGLSIVIPSSYIPSTPSNLCNYTNSTYACPILDRYCTWNSLVLNCVIDAIVLVNVTGTNNTTIIESIVPSFGNNFSLVLHTSIQAQQQGVNTTTITYSLNPSKSVTPVLDSNPNDNKGVLAVNLFSNDIKRLLTLGTKLKDRISFSSSNRFATFVLKVLPSDVTSFSKPIVLLDFIFSDKIDFNIRISDTDSLLFERRVYSDELFVLSTTEYQYSISIPFFRYDNTILDATTFTIAMTSISNDTTLTDPELVQFVVSPKIINMVHPAINSDPITDTSLFLRSWKFYYVTSYSDSAILNILFETTATYSDSLSIFISVASQTTTGKYPAFPFDWQMHKLPSPTPAYLIPSIIKPNTDTKESWSYKDVSSTKQVYLLAVYGKSCPFKCYYKTRAYLTDDERILLSAASSSVTTVYQKREPFLLHYTTKMKILRYSNNTKLLGNMLRYSFTISNPTRTLKNPNIGVYIRKDLFPNTQLYDFKDVACGLQINGHIELSDTIYDHEWYFGYIFTHDNTGGDTMTATVKASFWIDEPTIFVDKIQQTIQDAHFDVISIGGYINNSQYDPGKQLSNVPFNVIYTSIVVIQGAVFPISFYSKIGEVPYSDDCDISFRNSFTLNSTVEVVSDVMLTINYVLSSNGGSFIFFTKQPILLTPPINNTVTLGGYNISTWEFSELKEDGYLQLSSSNLLFARRDFASYGVSDFSRTIYQSLFQNTSNAVCAGDMNNGTNATTSTVTVLSYSSFPRAVALTTRYDGYNPMISLNGYQNVTTSASSLSLEQTNGTNTNLTPVSTITSYAPFVFSFDINEIMTKYYKNFEQKTTQNELLPININPVNPNDYLALTLFRIEITFWDIVDLNEFSCSIVGGFQKLVVPQVGSKNIPPDATLEKEIYKYKKVEKDVTSPSYYYMAKYSLSISLQSLYNYSSYHNITQFGYNALQPNSSFYVSIWNQTRVYHHEIISFIVGDGKISNELTFLPYTTNALIAITALVFVVAAVFMFGFSCKLLEKYQKRKTTTFETLRDNDPLCFACSIWFNLFGAKARSRRARQLQIFVPAMFIFVIGLVSVVVFLALALSYSDHVVCCSQAGDVIYQFNKQGYDPSSEEYKNEQTKFGLYTLGTASTKCFISSIYSDISQVQSTQNQRTTLLHERHPTNLVPKFVIPILDRPSQGVNNAVMLCPRSVFKSVVIRGSDIFGMVGTLWCGILITLSFSLCSVLFIEVVLGSWFLETVLFPKLAYRVLNE
ncbi:hypothetical protein C9374_013495 [Naegleria lovaniensis]|uniref:Transmembrane protein n=1 Tax=Naegleria lovaniensis TaxID=51637 RepID=A0AA88GZE9_NAELO|nr:uncharacterized protein C9374_013495 [Naegleria lovaniensis]KAG2392010.1 hypothetical protein C9374_013495 [Naegleria lovaniensis]